MKKLNLVLGIFVIGMICFVRSCGTLMAKNGNGDIETYEVSVSDFANIDNSCSASVRFHASDEYRAVISVDSNLEEYTRVYTDGNVLHIDTENGNYDFTEFVVDVYCPTLNGVTLTGSGSFSSDETIITSNFNAEVTGSGSISGSVDSDTLYARGSGSGSITIAGNSDSAEIRFSGSGSFRGSDFSANNADVRVTGSGSVTINVINNLKADLSGSGSLHYGGDPDIDSEVTGSGDITKI
jgi:hypothetical protein